MLPPNDQPNAPKNPKYAVRGHQSARPDRRTAAIAARAPGIMAPYSCPKFPRIPQPIDSDSADPTTSHALALDIRRLLDRSSSPWASTHRGEEEDKMRG